MRNICGRPYVRNIISLYSVDTDESVDEDDGASTCSDDSFVTALEEPSMEAQREANTVLNSSYVPMEIDPVDSDVDMADASESKAKAPQKKDTSEGERLNKPCSMSF